MLGERKKEFFPQKNPMRITQCGCRWFGQGCDQKIIATPMIAIFNSPMAF
jgi:hypothetical protein